MNPRIYITEYNGWAKDQHGHLVQMPGGDPVKEQSFDLTDRSQSSSPFDERTLFIEVTATAPFCIAFGDKAKAKPTLHRIAPNVPYQHAAKRGEQIAFILAEDAMEMMGPSGGTSGMTASEALNRAIELFSKPEITKAAVVEFQKVETSARAALQEARKAHNLLSEKQEAFAVSQQLQKEQEQRLTAAAVKHREARDQLAEDAAKLARDREDVEKEITAKRAVLADEVKRARDDIEAKHATLEAYQAQSNATLAAQQAALDVRLSDHQRAEDELRARDKAVSDREAVVLETENRLAVQIKKLRDAGIHVADAPPALRAVR